MKNAEEVELLKSRVRNLEKAAKTKEKEVHNLSRSLENARTTIKTCKAEKSQLKTSKSILEAEIRRLKRNRIQEKNEVRVINKDTAGDTNVNNNLVPNNLNSVDLSELTDPLYLPSMVSHWIPQVTRSYQRPGSISSMITHCALLPPPGSSFISMEEVKIALDKLLDKWFPRHY